MLQSISLPLSLPQNLRTFPPYQNFHGYPNGLSDLDGIPATKAKSLEHFHTNAGSLCASFLQSSGSSPTTKWLAIFLYEEGWATHDGKVWTYAIFRDNGTQRLVHSLQAAC